MVDLLKVDANKNGIPDFRDPEVGAFLWQALRFLIRTFARPHTDVYRALDAFEAKLAAAAPASKPQTQPQKPA